MPTRRSGGELEVVPGEVEAVESVLVPMLGASVAERSNGDELEFLRELGQPAELSEKPQVCQQRAHVGDLRRQPVDLELGLVAALRARPSLRWALHGQERLHGVLGLSDA